MKRIFVLCMACMVLFAGVASAEIKKDKDETGLYVCSTIEKKELGFTVKFTKNVVGEESFYRLHAYAHSKFRDFVLADKPISLLIDKYPSFYLDQYHYGVSKGYDEFYSSITDSEISASLIEKIKHGKDVSLWCTGTSTFTAFILLAPDFLNEWKQVINTTE